MTDNLPWEFAIPASVILWAIYIYQIRKTK
jgi:hypothetical protein